MNGKHRNFAGAGIAVAATAIFAFSFSASAAGRSLNWRQTDTSLALRNGTDIVWRLVYDPQQQKTYFHPLATIDGDVLTAFRPPDHPWHRGLWWSWKFINGLNYWEEDKKTGKSQGVNELTGATVTTGADFSATAELHISYHPPGRPPVMTEVRNLAVSAPAEDGSYAIDWTAAFTVGDKPVKLDRTPPHEKGGVAWGGYAGLSLRFPHGIRGWHFLTSEGATNAAAGNGKTADWADFSGPKAGIAVFDSPANLRHPSPWYLNAELPYFSPALLYSEPLELAPGQKFTLHYRILVHPGKPDAAELENDWKAFAR